MEILCSYCERIPSSSNYIACCCAGMVLQEKSSVSDIYEHVRDGGSENDVQTMDAATDSQQQMMQMTDLDNVNDDDDDDDDVDKPRVPEIENDIIQVMHMCLNYIELIVAVFRDTYPNGFRYILCRLCHWHLTNSYSA